MLSTDQSKNVLLLLCSQPGSVDAPWYCFTGESSVVHLGAFLVQGFRELSYTRLPNSYMTVRCSLHCGLTKNKVLMKHA